jgi:hypothetical protein
MLEVLVVMLGIALAGCEQAEDAEPTDSGGGTGGTSNPSGPSGTLKLSGGYMYDGPFTDMFVCNYDSSPYLHLEGQHPYLLKLEIFGARVGTFEIPNYAHLQDGVITIPEGSPTIMLYSIRHGTDFDALSYYATGGSMTLEDGLATGHATFTAIDSLSDTVTLDGELTWKDCVDAG